MAPDGFNLKTAGSTTGSGPLQEKKATAAASAIIGQCLLTAGMLEAIPQ